MDTNSDAGLEAREIDRASLEIPADYLGWMRFAAVKELETEGESLVEQARAARKELVERGLRERHDTLPEPAPLEHAMADLNGTRRHLSEALVVTTALCEMEEPGRIFGRPEALVWLLDSVCRHVIAQEISDSYGALEGEGLHNHLAPMIAALNWAGDEAARLRVIANAEREEARSEKKEQG
jgi:hypothetical protein